MPRKAEKNRRDDSSRIELKHKLDKLIKRKKQKQLEEPNKKERKEVKASKPAAEIAAMGKEALGVETESRIRQKVLFGGYVIPPKDTDEYDEPVELMFDDTGKYVEFVKHVHDHFRRRGLDIPRAPVANAVRVHPSLLERIPEHLAVAMRPITERDIEAEKSRYTGDDESDLKVFEASVDEVILHMRRLTKK